MYSSIYLSLCPYVCHDKLFGLLTLNYSLEKEDLTESL